VRGEQLWQLYGITPLTGIIPACAGSRLIDLWVYAQPFTGSDIWDITLRAGSHPRVDGDCSRRQPLESWKSTEREIRPPFVNVDVKQNQENLCVDVKYGLNCLP